MLDPEGGPVTSPEPDNDPLTSARTHGPAGSIQDTYPGGRLDWCSIGARLFLDCSSIVPRLFLDCSSIVPRLFLDCSSIVPRLFLDCWPCSGYPEFRVRRPSPGANLPGEVTPSGVRWP